MIFQYSAEYWNIQAIIMKNSKIKLGKYQHYKSEEKKYEIIGVARHSETPEEMVVYRALYGDHNIWARPIAMFKGTVLIDGKKVPRFKYIGK